VTETTGEHIFTIRQVRPGLVVFTQRAAVGR
jgi:hypothetical protein